MVEVAVCRCRELEGPEADVIKGFVINTKSLVRVLDELMHRERRIVRLQKVSGVCSTEREEIAHLNNCIRDFWTGNDRVRAHHTVWVFLTNFGDQQCTHTRTSTTTK